ncbi:MAG: ORF6N domain-containing protein, partial [Elusimicrobiota bacterium]
SDYAESVTEEATCPRVGGLALGAALGIIRYSSLSGLCRYRHNPEDFMFELTAKEIDGLMSSRSHFATLKRGQNIKYAPKVFTEHGAVMLASVLNSSVAVEASVQVVRAFVRLRQMAMAHKELAEKLAVVERKLESHDEHIHNLFDTIRDLMEPAPEPRRMIGFRP